MVTSTYRMPDGAETDWDVMTAADAVAVVALTDDQRVILARQFRPGPDRLLDELPGGELNDGETPCTLRSGSCSRRPATSGT